MLWSTGSWLHSSWDQHQHLFKTWRLGSIPVSPALKADTLLYYESIEAVWVSMLYRVCTYSSLYYYVSIEAVWVSMLYRVCTYSSLYYYVSIEAVWVSMLYRVCTHSSLYYYVSIEAVWVSMLYRVCTHSSLYYYISIEAVWNSLLYGVCTHNSPYFMNFPSQKYTLSPQKFLLQLMGLWCHMLYITNLQPMHIVSKTAKFIYRVVKLQNVHKNIFISVYRFNDFSHKMKNPKIFFYPVHSDLSYFLINRVYKHCTMLLLCIWLLSLQVQCSPPLLTLKCSAEDWVSSSLSEVWKTIPASSTQLVQMSAHHYT